MATKTSDEQIIGYVKDTDLKHIAIIMDGNRRWAKERNLPSAFGHKKGVDALKKIMRACDDFGVKYLTVYAFSTENWNRKKEEVDFLMDLLGQTIKNELKEMHENGVVINFIGDLSKLSEKLQKILAHAVEVTKNNSGVHLQIAFNYGSRDEMVHAVKKIAESVKDGGEMRVSNYLLWQIAYSEFYITKTLWPDFDKEALACAIEEFHNRQRRYGK